jgi:hypothetical protein
VSFICATQRCELNSRYFLADRDWALYNQGEDATMPHILCIGEQDERDVGLDDYHPYGNESLDYVRNLVIVSPLLVYCVLVADGPPL